MENKKSLLELAKDLEILASDMKKDNDEFFRNIFGLAAEVRGNAKEFQAKESKPDFLKTSEELEEVVEEVKAAGEEADWSHEKEMREEEGITYEEHLEDIKRE